MEPFHQGHTFRDEVYRVVSSIPRGFVLTYGQVAKRAGSPGASRAVGSAMKHNPYPAHIVPCHRVVRSDGTLGFFNREGGTALKATMLTAEGVDVMAIKKHYWTGDEARD